jgi:hypothetical protein
VREAENHSVDLAVDLRTAENLSGDRMNDLRLYTKRPEKPSRKPKGTRDGVLQAAILEQLQCHIPALKTKRWRESVQAAFTGTAEIEHLEDDFWEYLRDFAYIPDAFVIDKDAMQLDFFEVEITSLMTTTKLQAYGEFQTIMNYYGIDFSLFSVNQHGHINEVFLLPHYIDWIRANAGKVVPNED